MPATAVPITQKLETFLETSWENKVFGDTFPKFTQERLQQAATLLGAIAVYVAPHLVRIITEGMPEQPQDVTARIVKKEILDKTLAFVPALTLHMGKLSLKHLRAVTRAVGIMYWGDQTMDRGDHYMPEAIGLVRNPRAWDNSPVGRRARSLGRIRNNVTTFALPEDRQFVLPTFYDQVLKHEVQAHELSRQYEALPLAQRPAFLAVHGAEFAEITTISAGLPSVASSLYAIRRQQNPSLPPLKDVYADPRMLDLLQVSNVTVRIWDDLGDREMDAGGTDKGVFAINPFNQYEPVMVSRFCDLAHIERGEQEKLQYAFRWFNETPRVHSGTVLSTLQGHIYNYVGELEQDLRRTGDSRLLPFVETVKPVVEIGYTNTLGDIAMSS